MFEIPLDMIATRATDTLYTVTHNEQDNAGGAMVEDSADPVAAHDIDALTDPDDTIPVSYLHVLANAQ